MTNFRSKISVCHLLTSTGCDLAAALGLIGHNRVLWHRMSHFCKTEPGACTLRMSDAVDIVDSFERLVRRYRAARMAGIERSIVANLEALFRLLFDAIEECLDLSAKHCICSWERRVGHAEEFVRFLIEVAHAYWSTGVEREWMYEDLERLACLANEVCERDGSISRRASDDLSAEACADRLSGRLFDAANDLWCDNWAREEWMSVVPVA